MNIGRIEKILEFARDGVDEREWQEAISDLHVLQDCAVLGVGIRDESTAAERPRRNDKICPETPMRVLLRAEDIPDKAAVCKRTGEQEYTLSRDLLVYGAGSAEQKQPMRIKGLFLLGPRGSINQVQPGTMLHWLVTAEDLVTELQRSWEGAPQ